MPEHRKYHPNNDGQDNAVSRYDRSKVPRNLPEPPVSIDMYKNDPLTFSWQLAKLEKLKSKKDKEE